MGFIKNNFNQSINTMCYKRLLVFRLIIFIPLIIFTSAVDVPNNPCRHIFAYKFDNNLWYGVIKLVLPDIGKADLKLKYSLGRHINVSNYIFYMNN